MSIRSRGWSAIVGIAGLGLGALPALAGLGGDLTSVTADGARMKAEVRAGAPAVGYSVQQLKLPSGTIVNEYISPAGKVFAVSWFGPLKPDLRQTLGSYFQQVVTASQQAPHNTGTRRHFEIKQPDLVFESHGRMRAFYGRAYVPSLFPPNVTVADIH
ncbi:MAG TPA: DUF2844 domain-containing protein [Steroidobacteraceae bacterium]|nr:DUF2844 domain-containing protein [Steroidobacteraceae bacterium]